jgi:hypothetical protein
VAHRSASLSERPVDVPKNCPVSTGQPIAVRSGPWTAGAIATFLDASVIPIRLATSGTKFPLVQSLWFLHEADVLWCCTQAQSVLAARLRADGRCGFEVSGDDPPYRGVRGTGHATLDESSAGTMLPRLIARYVGAGQSPLADWLLSRIDSEVAVRIDGLTVTSWDYSARM